MKMKKIFALGILFLLTFPSLVAQFEYLDKKISDEIQMVFANVHSFDIDQDGDIDIISTSASNYGDMVWFENLDNTLSFEMHLIDEDYFFTEVSAGDMDGDGDIDLCVGRKLTDKLVWYENDGNQEFVAHVVSDSMDSPTNANMIDLDGDGDLDIVASSYEDGEILWFKNDGNQVFTEHFIGEDYTKGLKIVDLDQDGDLDVIGKEGTSIQWFKNSGTQNFSDHYIVNSLYGCKGMAVEDLNSDGDLDIIIVAQYGDIIYIENDGSESFTSSVLYEETVNQPTGFDMKDMDNDGDLDFMVSSQFDHTVSWFENDGLDNFTADTLSEYVYGALGILTVDINDDGYLDIISSQKPTMLAGYASEINIFSNNAGNFLQYNVTGVELSHSPMKQSADIDMDGDLDIITLSKFSIFGSPYYKNRMQIHENIGEDRFVHRDLQVIDHENYIYFDVVDIDGDGFLDISMASIGMYVGNTNSVPGEVYWYKNDGTQQFTAMEISSGSNTINYVEMVDFDMDGDQDFMLFNDQLNRMVWLQNDGFQNFTDTNILTSFNPENVSCVDLDQDGDMDFVYGYDWNYGVRWMENDGNQNFASHYIETTQSIKSIALLSVDYDSDGDIDLISASHTTDEIRLYLNDGSANFTASVLINDNFDATSIKLFDFNNDGTQDLILSSGWYTRIYLQYGGLYLLPTENILYGKKMLFADIDMDGDIDVVNGGTSGWGNFIAWLDNLELNDYLHLSIQPFFDENGNGNIDSVDIVSNIGIVEIQPNNFMQYVSSSTTDLYLDVTGSFTISLNVDTNFWEPSDSLYRNIDIDLMQVIDSIIPIGYHNRHELLLNTDITGAWPRCNDTISHYINIQNFGSFIDSGYIEYVLDDSASFITSEPLPTIISGQSLIYGFSDIATTETIPLEIKVHLPGTIDTLLYELEAHVDTSLFTLVDSSYFDEIVRCSFDPNDKQVSPDYGDAGYTLSNGELEYLIRFQNTGNDTAFLVEVRDTLDLNLDISSFNLVTNSHPVTVFIDQSSQAVSFRFENINLTDTITNEEESHGYIKYKIRLLDGLGVSEIIENKAFIYFDENSPIETNTTLNTVFSCQTIASSIELGQNDSTLSVEFDNSYLNDALWIWNEDTLGTFMSNFSFNLVENGLGALKVRLENDLCSIDTTINFQIQGLGTHSYNEMNPISVFPNPTHSEINISVPQQWEKTNVEIRDISGQLLSKYIFGSKKDHKIKLPGVQGGYFLHIWDSKGEKFVFKVFKT